MSNTCQERARGTFQGTPFGCHHLKQLLTARLFVQQRHPRPERIGQYLRFSPHPPRAFPPSPTRGNTGRGRVGWLAVIARRASRRTSLPTNLHPGPPCNSSGWLASASKLGVGRKAVPSSPRYLDPKFW